MGKNPTAMVMYVTQMSALTSHTENHLFPNLEPMDGLQEVYTIPEIIDILCTCAFSN